MEIQKKRAIKIYLQNGKSERSGVTVSNNQDMLIECNKSINRNIVFKVCKYIFYMYYQMLNFNCKFFFWWRRYTFEIYSKISGKNVNNNNKRRGKKCRNGFAELQKLFDAGKEFECLKILFKIYIEFQFELHCICSVFFFISHYHQVQMLENIWLLRFYLIF